jgi:methyl-accepting chemotaxis protein
MTSKVNRPLAEQFETIVTLVQHISAQTRLLSLIAFGTTAVTDGSSSALVSQPEEVRQLVQMTFRTVQKLDLLIQQAHSLSDQFVRSVSEDDLDAAEDGSDPSRQAKEALDFLLQLLEGRIEEIAQVEDELEATLRAVRANASTAGSPTTALPRS